jgi:type I restriction enzyme, S subunit
LKIVKEILFKFIPNTEVWAFGSRVKFTNAEFADLDLVIVDEKKQSLTTMADLEEAFKESDLPFEVDILDYCSIAEHLKKEINKKYMKLIDPKSVKEGYKDTPLGLIPSDWEVVRFGEFVELGKSKYNPLTETSSLPCVELEHIDQGTGKILGFVDSKQQLSIKNLFEPSCCLFGKLRPYLRKYALPDFKGVCSSEIWVFLPKAKSCRNDFLFNLIQTDSFIQTANKTCGSKMPRADWDTLKETPIPLPPLEEQKKIAEILSTWDQGIDKLSTLITKKKHLKKGLTQKIFSQEVRFVDDNGDEFSQWEEKELGEILDYIQPTKYLVKDTKYNNSYRTPVLTAGKTFVLGYTSETDGIFENNLPVIIFDDFTTANKFVNFPFKVKSSAMKILIAKNNNDIKFIYEAMQIIKYEIGGHERHWISKFAFLNIFIPCLKEQNKIAEILSTQDKEINDLEKKLELFKQQKKGLMQILLTGRVRV